MIIAGCSRGSNDDRLLGTWTNHHMVAKQPALESIAFLPKNTVTIGVVDALAAAGWHPQTTSTGQYEIIAPEKLKITEQLGSVVLDYHIDGTRLILSGQGLAQLLGKDEPPQALEKSAQ
jgi:hypothetical protein